MASSKASAAIALFLSFNLLFFSMANASYTLPECKNGTLDLDVCVNVLTGGLLGTLLGNPYYGSPCCNLIAGLVAADAELCLCAIVKADVLGIIKLNLALDINVFINSYCKIPTTRNYKCSV